MSKMFAMAVPILPDKVEEWKNFANELKGKRSLEFKASRKKLGVRERTFHQHTPMGDFVIVTLEGTDPENAFRQFASGDDEFTKWFVQSVKKLHGVDLTQPPPGPLPVLVVDSAS